MDTDTSESMMHKTPKLPISELNICLTCKLCKGYFIDATTIIECLHTFCRSCIVSYLKSNKYCPICDVQVHKTKPLLNIRQDKTIQDLVYKLVPRLYHDEIKRRKAFYDTNNTAKPSTAEESMMIQYEYILQPDEPMDLTLNYHGCTRTPRYLRCSNAVSIAHLIKLIQAKYELTDKHKVEILFKEHLLKPAISLMDVVYIYSWKKSQPLELTYKIYECQNKKLKLENSEISGDNTVNNNNNWKEVQLRISENGEMSITGIQDSAMELLEATETYQGDIVLDEHKSTDIVKLKNKPIDVKEVNNVGDKLVKKTKKEIPNLKFIGKSGNKETYSSGESSKTEGNLKQVDVIHNKVLSPFSLNSELSVIPLHVTTNCMPLLTGGTTTVFSTINKTMCSTKSDETYAPAVVSDRIKSTETTINSVLKQSNSLKRKCEETEKSTDILPSKLSKPTILNHSIGLINLSNNHPLKKHSKLYKNGEKKVGNDANDRASPTDSKPIVINKNVSFMHFNRPSSVPSNNNSKPNQKSFVPCYTPKLPAPSKPIEKNGEKVGGQDGNSTYKASHSHHPPIITPSQLPHHQNLNSLQVNKQAGEKKELQDDKVASNSLQPKALDTIPSPVKTKPGTPIGYKTLRDPPKSWNSQINFQIAKANQKQLAAAAAAQSACSSGPIQGRYAADLKNVRPAKFFKGRQVPRFLGNPASRVKPMYQVQSNPENDSLTNSKSTHEKSEIKKHSIVKIDPKTLKPISEKAPETSNLSNSLPITSNFQESRLNPSTSGSGDLKINTSSVSIFSPLKLQQNSPKNEKKSPKSPHSPKIKPNMSTTSTIVATSSIYTQSPVLSPKQQRDKTNLTFTPSNPFIPNLASPNLNPNQFLFPGASFANYDPRFVAAYHSLLYNQRIAAAGLVPPPMSHVFGLNMGLNPPTSSPSSAPSLKISPKLSTTVNKLTSTTKSGNKKSKESSTVKSDKSLETALEKITQNKAKDMNGSAKIENARKEESAKSVTIAVIAATTTVTSSTTTTTTTPTDSVAPKKSEDLIEERIKNDKETVIPVEAQCARKIDGTEKNTKPVEQIKQTCSGNSSVEPSGHEPPVQKKEDIATFTKVPEKVKKETSQVDEPQPVSSEEPTESIDLHLKRDSEERLQTDSEHKNVVVVEKGNELKENESVEIKSANNELKTKVLHESESKQTGNSEQTKVSDGTSDNASAQKKSISDEKPVVSA